MVDMMLLLECLKFQKDCVPLQKQALGTLASMCQERGEYSSLRVQLTESTRTCSLLHTIPLYMYLLVLYVIYVCSACGISECNYSPVCLLVSM